MDSVMALVRRIGGRQQVAFAASRLDDRILARQIDLSTQALDEDVDDVGHRIVGPIPHVFGDVRAADDLAGPAHEILEQRVLAFGERDELSAAA